MCGIVGYVGNRECSDILLTGLRRLEYRGYDSAGIAIATGREVRIVRAEGKLSNLERAFHTEPFDGNVGIGHTRWATHGSPVERNAHPHRAGRIVLAHNGIIENYLALRKLLEGRGCEFKSVTDTEVVAHLIDWELNNGAESLWAATCRALQQIEGSYALVVMDVENPDHLVVARYASPMVLGRNGEEAFAASDIPAVLGHTRDFIFLEDGDTAILRGNETQIFDSRCEPVQRESKRINWDPISAEKQGYKHFMLKEIHEQPARIVDTLRGRVSLERGDVDVSEIDIDEEWLQNATKLSFVACGTSYYAAMIGKYIIDDTTLCVAISQSGETADTLAAMRQARELGAKSLAICNVIESTIARESDGVLYTHAGPEIGVASTKAFTTQVAAVTLLAIWLGRRRGAIDAEEGRRLIEALRSVPKAMSKVLDDVSIYENIAHRYSNATSFLYLGRGIQFPIAMEGALKLKEISYIHAEGYAAGEMKHGPIALIDEDMPVVVIAPKSSVYDKTLSNVEEVKAREGQIISIITNGDDQLTRLSDVFIRVPDVDEVVQPLVTSVAVQLLAYHIADFKGTDVDQPRNLAKSVTVE